MRRLGFVLFPFFSLVALAGLPPFLTSRTRTAQIEDRLPLRFERSGQGLYTARGTGFELSVSSRDSVLKYKDAEVRTRLAGASPSTQMEPLKGLPGSANYFVGDPAKWRTGVESFEGIRCRDAYPGVDLVFHGNPHTLEYDFVVKAHADPKAIRMELSD